VLTLLLAAVFIVPVLLGVAQAAKQAPELANYVVTANTDGIPVPVFIQHLPGIGDTIATGGKPR
jgi:hypothetical protein